MCCVRAFFNDFFLNIFFSVFVAECIVVIDLPDLRIMTRLLFPLILSELLDGK